MLLLCMVQIEPQYLAVTVAHKIYFATDCSCSRGSWSKELDAASSLKRKSVLCKSFGFPADNFHTKIEMLWLLLQKEEKNLACKCFSCRALFLIQSKKSSLDCRFTQNRRQVNCKAGRVTFTSREIYIDKNFL